MSNIFKRKEQNTQPISERVLLQNKYNSSRNNLLLVVVFSIINVFICIFGGETYFLFSAIVPYYIAFVGAMFCGRFSDEFYAEVGLEQSEFWSESFLAIFVAIAIIIIAIYLVLFIFSKKRVGFLIAALVCFIIDTIALFYLFGIAVDSIVDYIFHAWVIISLIIGIRAHFKLKNLPQEEENPANPDEFSDGFGFPEIPADDFN